jgi:hypothetical protein
MRRSPHANDVLKSGGFAFHYYIGRLFKVKFFSQCCIIAALAASVILIGSAIDGSLVLPGRSIGLLEHPGIWIFFVLQVALPLSIRYSLKKLIRARSKVREVAKSDAKMSALVIRPLVAFLRLKDRESRFAATIIYSAGLAAFVWNTYQNELPGVIIPYDFWDSKNFVFGFWLTRVYKLYMLGWFLPYIGMIHVGILVVVLRIIRRARVSGKLKLIPFHPDGVGGLGFVPGLVTTPIIVTVLVSSISTAAAFEVHRAADVTPIMGLTIIILATGIAYVIPILVLRADIVAMKRETIAKLRLLQQAYYSKIVDGGTIDFEKVRNCNEALDYFERVCARIQTISNYPHLKRLLGYMALAITPSIASLILKSFEDVAPIIRPLLKKP